MVKSMNSRGITFFNKKIPGHSIVAYSFLMLKPQSKIHDNEILHKGKKVEIKLENRNGSVQLPFPPSSLLKSL